MKNNICIDAPQANEIDMAETLTSLKDSLKAPAEWLRQYYSQIIGRQISMRQVVMLLNAQFSLLAVVSMWACPAIIQLLSVVWFGCSVWGCKHSLSRK